LALVSALTFSTSGSFASSLISAGWTPGAAVTARVSLAAIVLTLPAVLLLRGHWDALRRSGPTLLVYGVAAVAGAQLCFFLAVQHLSVAVALLLEYSGALLVVLWLWLRQGERPGRLTLAGAAAAAVGLALVLDIAGNADLSRWACCGASARPSGWPSTSSSRPRSTTRCRRWSWRGAGLPWAASCWRPPAPWACCRCARRGPTSCCSTRGELAGAGVGLVLVAAVLAYVAGIVAARLLGARMASFVGLTEVLFAVAVAWVLLGQSLGPAQLLGGALVVAASRWSGSTSCAGRPSRPRLPRTAAGRQPEPSPQRA
jgi:drug/metabolite transporter (DMT)-like permease